MPHKLPDEMVQLVKAKIPPTHKMWWIRGIVLGVHPYQYKNDEKLRVPRTIVQIGDVDAPGEGYDVILEASELGFAEGDLVSLFGHEPIQAEIISAPRFLIHHSTGTYTRAYADVKGRQNWDNLGQLIKYKNWLSCQSVADSTDMLKKAGMFLGIPLLVLFVLSGGSFSNLFIGFYLLFILLLIGGFFVLPVLVGAKIAGKINDTKSFTKGVDTHPKSNFLSDVLDFFKHKYIDITALYEEVAIAVNAWIRQHPDPENNFVVVDRGQGTQGRLLD